MSVFMDLEAEYNNLLRDEEGNFNEDRDPDSDENSNDDAENTEDFFQMEDDFLDIYFDRNIFDLSPRNVDDIIFTRERHHIVLNFESQHVNITFDSIIYNIWYLVKVYVPEYMDVTERRDQILEHLKPGRPVPLPDNVQVFIKRCNLLRPIIILPEVKEQPLVLNYEDLIENYPGNNYETPDLPDNENGSKANEVDIKNRNYENIECMVCYQRPSEIQYNCNHKPVCLVCEKMLLCLFTQKQRNNTNCDNRRCCRCQQVIHKSVFVKNSTH